MKITFKHLLSVLLILLGFYIPAQSPYWQWAIADGSPGANDVATDAQGNSYVTGLYKTAAVFGSISLPAPPCPKVFTAKYDASGNCLWVKSFGGSLVDVFDVYSNQGNEVSIDAAGNCYVVGYFRHPAGGTVAFGPSLLTGNGRREPFLLKYDASGNEVWARQATGPKTSNYSECTAIKTDAAGNSYIIGRIQNLDDSLIFGNTPVIVGTGCFAAKYDASGNALWATKVGSNIGYGYMTCFDIALDAAGNSFISGFLTGTNAFSTNPVSTIAVGGLADAAVVKLNSSGNIAWARNFFGMAPPGPLGPQTVGEGRSIAVDPAGNIFIGGQFCVALALGSTTLTSTGFSQYEMFVAKLDPNGDPLWAQQSSGGNSLTPASSCVTGLVPTAGGDCYITAGYNATSPTPYSYCGNVFPAATAGVAVFKTDPAGSCLWNLYSSGSYAMSGGMALDGAGDLYLAGAHSGSNVFGSTAISDTGGDGLFLAKIGFSGASTGLDEIGNGAAARVYPNPSGAFVNFELNRETTGKQVEISICNLLGQEVKHMTTVDEEVPRVQVGDLAPGIYLYTLRVGNTKAGTGKLVVE